MTGKYTKLLVDYEWVSGQHQQCRRDLDQKNKEYDVMLQFLEDAEKQILPVSAPAMDSKQLISEVRTERSILVQKEQ